MKSIVFLCTENSCRSQIAEAYANLLSNYNVKSYSAGSKAVGVINPGVYTSFKNIKYNLKHHYSKGLNELPDIKFNAVVLMGCDEDCPKMNANKIIEWHIPDPKNMDQYDFNKVRDQIKQQVLELLEEMKV